MGASQSGINQPLSDLSREELLALVESQQVGIKIQFPGRDAARSLARLVRPRTSRTIAKHSSGPAEEQAQNLVIEGDNLQAMASLYRFRGQVDLVLTDPPYNTGNDWRYNDRWDTDPNDPGLGDWVGPEDAGRHTKWMRFMYPRLQMMKSMLRPTGVLAICIDHRELFRLGEMLDEIFGQENRLGIINWQKTSAPKSANIHLSTATEYVLVYARDAESAKTARQERTESSNSRYTNPDEDPKGLWREGNLTAPEPRKLTSYAIQSPFTGEIHYPAGNGHWRRAKADIQAWLSEWGTPYVEVDLGDGQAKALMATGGEIDKVPATVKRRADKVLKNGPWPFVWFGLDGSGRPRVKTYLEEIRRGVVPVTYWADDDLEPLNIGSTSWAHGESGRSSDGVAELNAVLGSGHGFETVKPLKLIQKVIQLWCPSAGLVLDPFAGSGTTGHATLALNDATDAARRFILIERGRPDRGDSYARTLMAERLRRVVTGDWANGKGSALGGGFRFLELQQRIDADAVLRMERDEMLDTVIASHYDGTRKRGQSLVSLIDEGFQFLIAKNSEDEGFFLIWEGPDKNTDFTEEVYEAIAEEAEKAKLKRIYHVYARLYVFQTENVRFYQIPDRILADFGLNLGNEPFTQDFA